MFDIHCEDASGARFIVEMQVEDQEYFIKRSLFYICMAVANLAKKGKMESRGKKVPYDYNIPTVNSLSFLNFDTDFGKNCDEVIQYISLYNVLHPEVRYDHINMIYVRLTKFEKTENECRSDLDRMLFIFKNAQNLAKVPPSFNGTVFKRILDIARISNFNVEELMDYENDMKHYSDHMNALAYAKKKGLLQGDAMGEARGVTIGLKRGKSEIARNMLGEGLEPALVARYTKLPLKAVKALR